MRHSPHSIEVLENRIAPAVFFVSGTNLTIKDSHGTDSNDALSALTVGASLAVKVRAGDSIILDENGNGIRDVGEILYASIRGGQGMFFFTDRDSSFSIQPNEATGIAAGNNFLATINGELHGSVATVLSSTGTLTPTTLQDASIAGLNVSGQIIGDVRAGKNISNLNIGGGEGTDPSVISILTGTEADDDAYSFNAGTLPIQPAFTFAVAGEAGGSIQHLTLANGVSNIQAGDGNAHPVRGGAGGNIVDVHLLNQGVDFNLIAGDGATTTTAAGIGGNGGLVLGVHVTLTAPPANHMTIMGGNGGNGNTGGIGGLVKAINATFEVDTSKSLSVGGGNGGNGNQGDQKGAGGAGGSALNVTMITAHHVGQFTVFGGVGGSAGTNGDGKGGAGGSTIITTINQAGGEFAPLVYGGAGGAGAGKGTGGNGGNVIGANLSGGAVTEGISVYGGDAGSGGNNGMNSTNGFGGIGGSVVASRITVGATSGTSDHHIHGGDGGNGGFGLAAGKGGSIIATRVTTGPTAKNVIVAGGLGGTGTSGLGGDGGAILNSILNFGDANSVTVNGGDGGSTENSTAGRGGAIIGTKVFSNGTATNGLTVTSGDGGEITLGTGTGGSSGNVLNSSLIKSGGNQDNLAIRTGNGAQGHGTGNGGFSGSILHTSARGIFGINRLTVQTGDGGDAGSTGLKGGAAGKIASLLVTTTEAFAEDATIQGGKGGGVSGANAVAGAGGSLSGITFTSTGSVVQLGGGAGGDGGAGAGAFGGAGGSIGTIRGRLGTLVTIAGQGGNAGANGGNGGGINDVVLGAVGHFVRLLRAGDGGNGNTLAGKGGSVTNVVVPVSIGSFSSSFAINDDNTGMGGLIAGLGGVQSGNVDTTKNGFVANITATRIAAILAGAPAPDALSAVNAVARVSGLHHVTAIGADTDENTFFTFTDSGSNGFHLDEGDTAIDGLVIVKEGKFLSAITPLMIVKVP